MSGRKVQRQVLGFGWLTAAVWMREHFSGRKFGVLSREPTERIMVWGMET